MVKAVGRQRRKPRPYKFYVRATAAAVDCNRHTLHDNSRCPMSKCRNKTTHRHQATCRTSRRFEEFHFGSQSNTCRRIHPAMLASTPQLSFVQFHASSPFPPPNLLHPSVLYPYHQHSPVHIPLI